MNFSAGWRGKRCKKGKDVKQGGIRRNPALDFITLRFANSLCHYRNRRYNFFFYRRHNCRNR
ncbi:MAG: hypothetical protein ACLVLD_07210, partial [Hungatella sp.]